MMMAATMSREDERKMAKMAQPRRPRPRTLGDCLRLHRERQHVTQSDIAEILGVSQAQYSKWENDLNEPLDRYIQPLKDWLQVSDRQLADMLYWSKVHRAERELLSAELKRQHRP